MKTVQEVYVVKIRAYIGEATEYDKKETLEERRPKSWLKSVSAFANGNGGVLLFGVADDDALKGLPDVKTASEKISEAVKSKMDPIPSIELQIRQEEGKDFILLHVAPGAETPYYYIGDGGRIAYIRVGNESVQATASPRCIGLRTLPLPSSALFTASALDLNWTHRILFRSGWWMKRAS